MKNLIDIVFKNWKTTLFGVLVIVLEFLKDYLMGFEGVAGIVQMIFVALGLVSSGDGDKNNNDKPPLMTGLRVNTLIILMTFTFVFSSCVPAIKTTKAYVKISKTLALEDIKAKYPSYSVEFPVDSITGKWSDKYNLVSVSNDSVALDRRKYTIEFHWDNINAKVDSIIDVYADLLIEKINERKNKRKED